MRLACSSSTATLTRPTVPNQRPPARPPPAGGLARPWGTLTLRSETLGLELRAVPGREMRFQDPATGEDLRSHDEEAEARLEEAAARVAAETRVAAAETRAATAEARVAELEAILRGRSG